MDICFFQQPHHSSSVSSNWNLYLSIGRNIYIPLAQRFPHIPFHFMFHDGECTFSNAKHTFTDGECMFPVGEHRLQRGEKNLHSQYCWFFSLKLNSLKRQKRPTHGYAGSNSLLQYNPCIAMAPQQQYLDKKENNLGKTLHPGFQHKILIHPLKDSFYDTGFAISRTRA